jgi:hypothetical protein
VCSSDLDTHYYTYIPCGKTIVPILHTIPAHATPQVQGAMDVLVQASNGKLMESVNSSGGATILYVAAGALIVGSCIAGYYAYKKWSSSDHDGVRGAVKYAYDAEENLKEAKRKVQTADNSIKELWARARGSGTAEHKKHSMA